MADMSEVREDAYGNGAHFHGPTVEVVVARGGPEAERKLHRHRFWFRGTWEDKPEGGEFNADTEAAIALVTRALRENWVYVYIGVSPPEDQFSYERVAALTEDGTLVHDSFLGHVTDTGRVFGN